MIDTVTNRHKGKRFYVCGFSPNIKHLDNNYLVDGVVIAINDFYFETPYAHYWICYDGHKMATEKGFYGKVEKIDCPKFIRHDGVYADSLMTHENLGDITWYKDKPAMASDINREWDGKLCHIGTTATNAIHLAYIMGAGDIVLWGVDLTGDERADGSVYAGTDYWGRFRSRFNAYIDRFPIPIYRTNPNAKINAEFLNLYRDRERNHAPSDGEVHTTGSA